MPHLARQRIKFITEEAGLYPAEERCKRDIRKLWVVVALLIGVQVFEITSHFIH